MEDCAEDVEDIAEEPDDDEGEGEAVGGGAAEVLDYLRGENNDPAGNGYGSGGSQDSQSVGSIVPERETCPQIPLNASRPTSISAMFAYPSATRRALE